MLYQEVTEGSGQQSAPPATSQLNCLPSPETIDWPQFRGLLYQPADEVVDGRRLPAVVILPAPDEGSVELDGLLAALTQTPIIALVIMWDEEPLYPESLAIVPGAIEFLSTRDAVDPARIGILGVSLAADLVLRSSSTDPQVRSVLALGPYLSSSFVRSGLVSRLRRQPAYASFLAQIDSLAALRQLSHRQLQLVFGAKDSPTDLQRVSSELELMGLREGDVISTLCDVRARDMLASPPAIQFVQRWFEKTL
jgi:hypothetical protein